MFAKSTLASLVGALLLSFAATASAEYEAWYVEDTDNHGHLYGQVSVNHSTMTPPSWACGLRFKNPQYLIWNFPYDNPEGIDLDENLFIWIDNPGANCPHNDLLIEYTDQSQQFPHQLGASNAEIWTDYAASWVDADGKTKFICCKGFNFKITAATWNFTPLRLGQLKALLADPRQQHDAYRLALDIQTDIAALTAELADQIALRRRTPAADSEISISQLEDAASNELAVAARQLAASASQAGAGRYADAYRSADLSAQALESANLLIDTAQNMIDPE
jgi:hypothetical protein